MDVRECSLPDCINPNNFPAKLWRLVNNPAYKAIFWDTSGEVIVIDQHHFQRQILSPGTVHSDNADAFKTTNFSSFVRQLNLYGFKKADPAMTGSHLQSGDGGTYHHFYNPNFKRSHPELVASLRRLTVDNKAKLQAGQDVNCRPPSRYLRFTGCEGGRDTNVKRGSSSFLTHPYYPNKAQAMTAHNGTPVPPRYLIRGHAAQLSRTVFATDKRLPAPLSRHCPGLASSSNAVHIQQGLLACANRGDPNFAAFNSPVSPYQPGYYSPVCQCYRPSLVASHMTGSGLQTGLFSPHSYYQANYPVDLLSGGDHNREPQNEEHQEVKKCDINLDTIFQIADEMMQTPPHSCLVQVVTPEKPGPLSVSHPMNASPGPIIMAVSDSCDLVRQQEESVVSNTEKLPEDAIVEVTGDDPKDIEVISIEVSDTLEDTSEAHNSSCTGSTPNH